jgi:hypothetical protein
MIGALALISIPIYLLFGSVFIAAYIRHSDAGIGSALTAFLDYQIVGFGVILVLACVAVVIAFAVDGFKDSSTATGWGTILFGLALIMPVVRILEIVMKAGFKFPYSQPFYIWLICVSAFFFLIDAVISVVWLKHAGLWSVAFGIFASIPWAWVSGFASVAFSTLYFGYMKSHPDPWWGKTLVSIIDVPLGIALAVLPSVGLSALLNNDEARANG